jgi:hypothetical protein
MSSDLRHPAPLYKKTSRLHLLIGLVGAPAAWVGQMLMSEMVSSHACYPRRAPLPEPLWQGMHLWLTAFSLLCLAAGICSGIMAFTTWRRVQHEVQSGQAPAAAANTGSMRFLAILGLLSSGLFVAAILFTACASLLVSPCSPWF